MRFFKDKSAVILVHVFCWIIFSLGVLFSRPGEWRIDITSETCARQFVQLGILISVFYCNIYLLIPHLLFRKKVLEYIIVIVALVIVIALVNKLTAELLYPGHRISHNPGNKLHRGIDTFVPGMVILIVGLGVSISYIEKWQQEVQLRMSLQREKISSELILLKAQINPHFFFNTLNTIYSFTLSDGKTAREAITNLSKMMRYVLYETEENLATLAQEVSFIGEYVALMRLRLSSKNVINFEVDQLSGNLKIAPMLFLPFVENAFKHGTSNADASFVTISISQYDEHSVKLRVTNSIHDRKKGFDHAGRGIGIKNTRRRLEILYPGQFELSAGPVGSHRYEAILNLSL